jgi:hypothetical protein
VKNPNVQLTQHQYLNVCLAFADRRQMLLNRWREAHKVNDPILRADLTAAWAKSIQDCHDAQISLGMMTE